MSSQKIMLQFSDLKNLSSLEIVEAISPETAVEVTLKSIKSCELSEQEIYKTWSTSLFKSYGPTSGITDKDLNNLFDSFSVAIKELLDECGDCQNDEQMQKLSEFLNYSLELFTWIHSAASEFETKKITSFLCFGLFAIHSYLVFLSKQTSKAGARKLIVKSLEIHILILSVLTEYPKTFIFDANESSLGNLISGLCSIGEITTKLDIKAAVDTWKCITRLASQNIAHNQSENYTDPADDVIWLSKPMSFLIKEIGRNVQTVYTQNSLSEPIEQIQKYLKVTNFYLRLLTKLTKDFQHVPFSICEEFIGTLVVVFNPPIYITKTNVYKVIMDYIGKELKELMPLAYKRDMYFEQLLNEHTRNVHSSEAIDEIMLQTMEVIFRKDEPRYLNEQLLDSLFNDLINTSKEKYNRFVEILSSFQIRYNDEQLKKKLISTILHDNTTEALAAIDILCTTFMLSNEATRQLYLKFWIDINERFVIFSNTMPALHTEFLLKNFYTMLSSQEKNEMWKKFNACTLKHERFLLAIGLDTIPSCATKQSIIQHFLKELLRLLKESQITTQSYYMIVKDLKLLKPIDFQNDELIELLYQYLEIAIDNKNLYRMAESILDFLAPRIGYIDGSKIQKILTMFNMNISVFADRLTTKLSFIEFLKSVGKLSKFEKQSKETIKSLIESDEQINLFGYLEENNITEIDSAKSDNLWKELIQNRSMTNIQRSHICKTRVTSEVLMKNPQTDIDVLLEDIEKSTNKLQTQTQIRQLSTYNLETMKRIVFKLKGISNIDLKID